MNKDGYIIEFNLIKCIDDKNINKNVNKKKYTYGAIIICLCNYLQNICEKKVRIEKFWKIFIQYFQFKLLLPTTIYGGFRYNNHI
ncbi:MAG: hypothetical protein ACE5SW_11580 [Nitrososphaeraceae archaeon]